MNIAFIPVRGGSKSIPLKNIKILNGKPLVYWTVKSANEANCIDKVVVATDSEEIKQTVLGFSFDKVEISKISEQIGAYETSVLPYEDCCSVFLPDSPVTHPKIEKLQKNEALLNREELIKNAIENIETIIIKN